MLWVNTFFIAIYFTVTDPERELYLAVSDRIYNNFFLKKASQFIVNQNQISILVVEIQSEVISQWIR
ncbi:MAG: element excision factor XisH family protein [Microcoleus sp.]